MRSDRGDPARMRAIPNNAILQQFGYVANVVAGLGAAVGVERERFVELAKKSPRLRPLIEMIARAKQLSSLNAVGANAIIFDAGFWAQRAAWEREPHLDGAFKFLADASARRRPRQKINGLAHSPAARRHRAALAFSKTSASRAARSPTTTAWSSTSCRRSALALIMRIFILTAQLPRFTPTNEVYARRDRA